MTIYFSGHSYKYEVEAIIKLFFPVMHFTLKSDDFNLSSGNFIFTRVKYGRDNTYLSVIVKHNDNYARRLVMTKSTDIETELVALLFCVLSTMLNIRPNYGILTGIRPVSTVRKWFNSGLSSQCIATLLSDRYMVSDKKIALLLEIAENQLLIPNATNDSYSLYVSIPFCPSRCSYCSFVSHSIDSKKSLKLVDEYIVLLCKELRYTAKLADELKLKLLTIYIGGGTPTAITAMQLKVLTDTIAECFNMDNLVEYTIEAGRADTIDRDKLAIIKHHATRISINPQTLNDDVLMHIGRKHTVDDVINSYKLARELGLNCINMDLIAGLPTDTLESFKASIDGLIALSPENITVHTLAYKRAAAMFNDSQSNSQSVEQMVDYAYNQLKAAGYIPYYLYKQKNTVSNLENIGYAKKGFLNAYNFYIMEEEQTIIATGAGGVTKLVTKDDCSKNIERVFNYKYHFEYILGFDEIIMRKDKTYNIIKSKKLQN